MVDMTVKIGNVIFKNPVLTASGTFGYGDEIGDLIDVNSLGGIITKSVTFNPRKGNPPPRIVETSAGMLNSIGLANIGVKRFVNEKIQLYKSFGTRVIVSVAGETIRDYCKVVEYIEKENNIDGYEINISCPNTERGGIYFGIDREMSRDVVTEIRKLTSKLLIVKLTPNVTSISEIAEVVEEAGADCVSLVNSFIGMAVDVKTKKPKIKNIIGGLTGPCIKPLALAKVYEVCSKIEIPVIGIGGIATGDDALEFLIAGASAVQVGTASFFDPDAPIKIVEEIKIYLEDNGIKRVSEIVGTMIVS
ncbi:MAG: dihydroorotate dehydrogenase [Candidatus Helarchaeota archaeon]|nr:dihydroorotate dehydrogenase [Candidatus Helarchaeota archaeon]